MNFLTSSHTAPPAFVESGGMMHPVSPRISRNTPEDTAWLAAHDIFPHETEVGDAPLGYTDWEFDSVNSVYRKSIAGTPEERSAAEEARIAAERVSYLDSLECTRLQGKLAMIDNGYWEAYETIITAMLPTMTPAQRVFVEDAQVWKFRDPVLQMFASAIELDEDAVISLIEYAKTK